MMDNYHSRYLDLLEKALADERLAPINLPFLFRKAITQDFSNDQQIGCGGFESVYKGALRNGMVAVKKLHNKIEVQEKDFEHEVGCLIKVKHKNIVRFLGYSYETQHILCEHGGRHIIADKPNMLFCFEYLSKGSLANYLTGPSSGLQWGLRYQIIKGICGGMDYLHQQQRIIHMDLKPDNILLDESMVPRIADFGISRRFSTENQSKIITENIVGSRGYMAPEYLRCGRITFKIDIYSLGVIIIEILMGYKEYCPNVDKVLKSWTKAFGTSKSSRLLLEQVKLCAEIGIDCMHDDPSRRPDIQEIICRLNETDITGQVVSVTLNAQLRPCSLSGSALLDIHPLELCFHFKAKNVARCSLSLTNRTDRYIAYFIRPQFEDMYTINVHFYNIKPMFTLVLNVEMVEKELPPLDTGIFEILMISTKSREALKNFWSSNGTDPQKIADGLLKRAKELNAEVHLAMLKAVVCPQRDAASKVISRVRLQDIKSIDVHSTQPWILVGHRNHLSICYYEELEATPAISLDINGNAHVTSVRFIPQKEWCVAGDDQGYIHVYLCLTMDEMKSLKATGDGSIESLAIHPNYPYLLSACRDNGVGMTIEIWDWEKGWACSRKVQTQTGYRLNHATFNPMDANTFVTYFFGGLRSASAHHRNSMSGHTTQLRYGHVFTETAGRKHVLLSSLTDLQIWDWQTRTRVHTIGYFQCTTAACHPTLPLIAAICVLEYRRPQAVCFWNSKNYRLEKTIRCISNRRVIYLGFVGSRRLVIGYENAIEVLEIDMESLAC